MESKHNKKPEGSYYKNKLKMATSRLDHKITDPSY